MDELVRELKGLNSEKEIDLDGKFEEINNSKESSLLFVDGGEALLYESASLGIGIVKVCGLRYMKKRDNKDIKEFFIIIEPGKNIRSIPRGIISLDIGDVDIKEALSLARRIAELNYCNEHISDADFIVLDGTLDYKTGDEKKVIEKLLSSKKICGLSKTTTARYGSNPITKILLDRGPENPWRYDGFVKLHKKSEYVFRIDMQDVSDKEDLLYSLVMNSNDPVFLGYPYGLMDVDQNARISENERKMMQMKLMAKMGRDWKDLSMKRKSMDAHEVLDTARY